MKAKNLVGKKFGKLLVLEKYKNSKNGRTQWLCKCDCGNFSVVKTYRLTTGQTLSCGCKKFESHNKKHGMKNTRIYSIWCGMKKRCYNHNDKKYKSYGAVGIEVCEEWKSDFESFYNWSIKNGYSENLTIDRINLKGNYSPENCRWITNLDQQNNKSNNVFIEYNGEVKTISEWCRKYNKNYKRVYNRIVHGVDFETSMFFDGKLPKGSFKI